MPKKPAIDQPSQPFYVLYLFYHYLYNKKRDVTNENRFILDKNVKAKQSRLDYS